MGGSPRAEDDGSGRYSKVNAGGFLLFHAVDASSSRAALRLGGFCEAAQVARRGGGAQGAVRRARVLALYSHAGPGARSAHAEAKDLAAAARACWPYGLRPAGGLVRCGRSGLGWASGSAQSGRVDFFRNIFQCKNKSRKCPENV
jgi:hypothetical protein